MKVKNNLALLMVQKGIKSVSELQRQLKDKGHPIARRTLDRFYNNDNNQIHYDTITAICHVLNCDIGDLFSLVETKEKENKD